jgi:Flp pilus assembly pilin Flp
MRLIRHFLACTRGQDLAEYAMALGIIAIGVVLIATALGTDVNSIWSRAQPAIQTVIDGEP